MRTTVAAEIILDPATECRIQIDFFRGVSITGGEAGETCFAEKVKILETEGKLVGIFASGRHSMKFFLRCTAPSLEYLTAVLRLLNFFLGCKKAGSR